MLKQTILIISLLSLLSCNNKVYIDQVDRVKFCDYFSILTGNSIVGGTTHQTVSTKINKVSNDAVSTFIQSHSYRFDYIINKTLASLVNADNNFDNSYINKKFCKAISNNTFYNQFILLTSGDRNSNNKSLCFSIPELMKIASRFFMCDHIRQKDTAISYHICIGINGISKLQTKRNYTVLEAFCFEAIFTHLHSSSKFISNFNDYIKKSSIRNKNLFIDFKTHLIKVRDECYTEMEKDKDLEEILLEYYRENSDNINFKIE